MSVSRLTKVVVQLGYANRLIELAALVGRHDAPPLGCEESVTRCASNVSGVVVLAWLP